MADSPFVELEVGKRTVKVTNPDKVFFRKRKETKLDLVRYYLSVGDGIVAYALEEAETRAGLILPASLEAHCRSGIVIAAGPDAEGVSPGDKVLFPKDAGYDVRLAGTAQRVIKRDELIARILD